MTQNWFIRFSGKPVDRSGVNFVKFFPNQGEADKILCWLRRTRPNSFESAWKQTVFSYVYFYILAKIWKKLLFLIILQ